MTDFLDLADDAVPDLSAPLAALHAETDDYILAGADAEERKERLAFADYNVLRVAKRYDVDPDALRRAVLASDEPTCMNCGGPVEDEDAVGNEAMCDKCNAEYEKQEDEKAKTAGDFQTPGRTPGVDEFPGDPEFLENEVAYENELECPVCGASAGIIWNEFQQDYECTQCAHRWKVGSREGALPTSDLELDEEAFSGTLLDGPGDTYVAAKAMEELALRRVAEGKDPHTGRALSAVEGAQSATSSQREASGRKFVVTVDGDLASARTAIDAAMGDYLENATGYRSGWSSSTPAGPGGTKVEVTVDAEHAGMVRPILALFGDVTTAMEASRAARRRAARSRRATQWIEDDGDYVPADNSMELSVEAKNGQFYWTMYAGLDAEEAEVVKTGGPYPDVREAQTEAEQAWLAREASHRVAYPTWQEMENRDDYSGWGYLNERASSQVSDSSLADAVALQIAADLGWSDDDLFEWANSRSGRYYGDLAFGGWNHSAEKLRSEAERMKLFDLSKVRAAKTASVVSWANEYTAFSDDVGQYMVMTGSAGRFTAEVTSFPDGSYEWALVERDAVRCGGAADTAEEAMDQCEIMAYRLGTGIAGDETERTVAQRKTAIVVPEGKGNGKWEQVQNVPTRTSEDRQRACTVQKDGGGWIWMKLERYDGDYGADEGAAEFKAPSGGGVMSASSKEDAKQQAEEWLRTGARRANRRVSSAFFTKQWIASLKTGGNVNDGDKGKRFVTLKPLRFVKDPSASYDEPDKRFDDLPAGQAGVIVGVESHGSNPWTRYTVELDSGQRKSGVSPSDIEIQNTASRTAVAWQQTRDGFEIRMDDGGDYGRGGSVITVWSYRGADIWDWMVDVQLPCTVDGPHCEQCGRSAEANGSNDGYSSCCNERIESSKNSCDGHYKSIRSDDQGLSYDNPDDAKAAALAAYNLAR